jgi:hypothetical protein
MSAQAVVISPRSTIDLERCRRLLVVRAELERGAMRDATEDLQLASDRIAWIAITGVRLVRRYWLPASVLVAATLFKRPRSALRVANWTGALADSAAAAKRASIGLPTLPISKVD